MLRQNTSAVSLKITPFSAFMVYCVKMALIFMPREFGCNVVGKLIENIRLEFPNVSSKRQKI